MSGDKRRDEAAKTASQPVVETSAGEMLAGESAAIVVTPEQPCAKRRNQPERRPPQELIKAISSHNAATLLLNRALFDYAAERSDRR